MAFKRAMWRSGLTYQHTCNSCSTVVQYTDDKLDFRPWYPNGFVYCPICRKPLRHSEELAVSGTPGNARPAYPSNGAYQATQQATPVQPAPTTQPTPAPVEPVTEQVPVPTPACPNCNKVIREGDVFCSGCGTKL